MILVMLNEVAAKVRRVSRCRCERSALLMRCVRSMRLFCLQTVLKWRQGAYGHSQSLMVRPTHRLSTGSGS